MKKVVRNNQDDKVKLFREIYSYKCTTTYGSFDLSYVSGFSTNYMSSHKGQYTITTAVRMALVHGINICEKVFKCDTMFNEDKLNFKDYADLIASRFLENLKSECKSKGLPSKLWKNITVRSRFSTILNLCSQIDRDVVRTTWF